MKVLTELFFNDNQKVLEKFSKYHTIESTNLKDLDHFRTVPKYKDKRLKQVKFTNASYINGSVRRMARNPMTKMDMFLISQIDEQLLHSLMLNKGTFNNA
jgi:hypothetical protein